VFANRRCVSSDDYHDIWATAEAPGADCSRRMNSGRKGVPPPGRPAPTGIASTSVDARRCAHQARFQSLEKNVEDEVSLARSACADRHRVHVGGRPAVRPSGAISIALEGSVEEELSL